MQRITRMPIYEPYCASEIKRDWGGFWIEVNCGLRIADWTRATAPARRNYAITICSGLDIEGLGYNLHVLYIQYGLQNLSRGSNIRSGRVSTPLVSQALVMTMDYGQCLLSAYLYGLTFFYPASASTNNLPRLCCAMLYALVGNFN